MKDLAVASVYELVAMVLDAAMVYLAVVSMVQAKVQMVREQRMLLHG